MELDRRQFIAGAGVASVATFAGTAVADEASPSAVPDAWDVETDVVVVGSGSIISAALRAHDQGLDVIVLEKHPTWFGGTTAISGGGMSCPNNTFNLSAGCPEIPRDLLKAYLMDVAEGHSSEELVDMMIDNYAPTVDYLNDECGYKWISFGEMPNCFYNYYNPFPEIEEAYPNVPCWVTIGDHEATGRQSGPALPEYAKDALAARGIEVMMGTPATRLIYAGNPALGDGEVVGVWAEQDGKPIAIKARYAVVLGTGGFDNNREMVEHYIDGPIYATTAIETNTGDGHIMAMELGANMKNMNEVFNQAFNMCEGADVYLASDLSKFDGDRDSVMRSHIWITPGATGSVIVNKYGERFVDESASYDLFGRAFHTFDPARKEWRNVPAFVIMDGSFGSNLGNGCGTIGTVTASDERPEWFHEFATMEELADGMGIDKEGLLATIERYNGFCQTGVDKDWARGENTWDRFTSGDMARFEAGELANPCMSPMVEGPFYCVELYPGMLQTCGGIEINGNAQVKNVRGEVIPRLYAGSCCAASPLGRGYAFGGTTLSIGYVPGFVAANHIATLQPWE